MRVASQSRAARAVALTLLLAIFSCGQAGATVLIRLHANRVTFYYNRFVVNATGNVDVRTSDGMEIRGDVFSMDLRLNRFLVAGNVQLRTAAASLSGAAVSDFLNFNRIYFIPVTSEPDRWTFLNGDFSHPVPGRIMPGDTFNFANTAGQRPDFIARSAVIGANSFLRLSGGVESNVFGVMVPVPPFYVNFAPTPALARNSLSGADADLTYQFAGNANYISALHLRYDALNRAYASFEQHFAGEHEYAVFSLNPATTPAKFWNLMTGDTMGQHFQINTFTQLYTYQYGFSEPFASAQYTYIWASEALSRWSLQVFTDLTNFYLGGRGGIFGNHQTVGEPNHPSQMQFTATSFPERIFGLPIFEQVFGGVGFNHDSVGSGLQNYGGVEYTTIWNQSAGFTISLPQLPFGNLQSAYDRYLLSGYFTKQRQWFTVPHRTDSTVFSVTVSRQIARSIGTYAGYSVSNTGDYYLRGGYSVPSPILNGVYDPGFRAFRGVATWRTFSFATNYVPSPEFSLTLLYRHHDDFPTPVPGVFPLPAQNPLGQYIYGQFLGEPPNDLTGDVHVQLARYLAVDVSRTYYFNYGTLHWSPTTIVQFSQ